MLRDPKDGRDGSDDPLDESRAVPRAASGADMAVYEAMIVPESPAAEEAARRIERLEQNLGEAPVRPVTSA